MNQWGGAKFAAAIAGNDEQRRTLLSGVSELPNRPGMGGGASQGPARAAELDDLPNGLAAHGYRERPGSMTTFNTKQLEDWSGSKIADTAHDWFPNPLKAVGKAVRSQAYKNNVGRLSDYMLMEPEEARAFMLKALRSRQSSGLMGQLLLEGPAQSGGGSSPPAARP